MNATCLIVFASMSGNTEEMANLIGLGIRQTGAVVKIKDIFEVDPKKLQEFDGVLLGAYTWGDGELPDEFLDLYEEMDCLDLNGKTASAFGSCNSSYEHWGRAVDILQEKLVQLGAMVLDGMKIELAPTDSEKEQCIQFGQLFAKRMKGV
jgi:flavodoxin I